MKPPTTRARWDYLAGPEPTRRESLVTLAGLLLIAAAPEMLAALKRLCTYATECEMHGAPSQVDGIEWDDVVAARAAIAKAEGRNT